MPTKHRLISTFLLAAMVAAAFGRADLAADTEASVLWSPAFRVAFLPALVCGWFATPWFGRAGWQGWALAAALVGATTLVTAAVMALAGQGHLLAAVPRQPYAIGALAFASVALHMVELRRQSRK